ncbi:MAG: YlqD family protein [Oscillatoriophycideae cyanobacterium NC_groundwater_1537_Pr4_S-0.65um_50_18]|nr:YlqD family protein [Oscillatoriophycideae cyanobacterium NC_groundwater_1537_Pr4_S-0.65um_50_18]
MEASKSNLLLKRAVNVKAIVTPRWKEETQQQLQAQINQIDAQIEQLDTQGQRAVADLRRQGAESLNPAMMAQQISSIEAQVNQKKSEILDRRYQTLQQLQQAQLLEMDQEVYQGQIESFFRVETGDNLVRKMQVEILLKDGEIVEIRGDL